MLVLGVALVASFAIVAVAQGIGDPSLDEGELAVVEDAPGGPVTTEDFDFFFKVAALEAQLPRPPEPGDEGYEDLRDAAMSDAIQARWILGEAADRGIEITDRELDEQLETVIEEQFDGKREEFERFLRETPYDEERAFAELERIEALQRLQEEAVPAEPDVSDEEIEDYYEANREQFELPETRDVRVITTRTEADAQEALERLEADDSPESFEAVAREFSTDEATKSTGGLREDVVEDQSEPALDEQIFAAPEGELVGPFETEAGFGVLRVEDISEASVTPLEEVRDQITATLQSARQQQIAASFDQDLLAKWRARTFCAEEYRIDLCANAERASDPCTAEQAEEAGCPAPVASARAAAPGSAVVFGAIPAAPLPQGPCAWLDPEEFEGRTCGAWPLKEPPEPAAAPGGFTPGVTPVPPGTAPPGAVPPGAAPPGTVPPGSVPPGAVPPGTVPPGAAPPGAVPPGAPPPAPPPGG